MTNEQEQIPAMPQYMERALRNYAADLESIAREFPGASAEAGEFAAVIRKAARLGKLHASEEDSPRFIAAYDAAKEAGRKNEELGKKLDEAEFTYGKALVLGFTRKTIKRVSHDFNIAAQKMPQHAELLKEMGGALRGIGPTLFQLENPGQLAAQARYETALDRLELASAKDSALGDLVDKSQEKFMYALTGGLEERHPGASEVMDKMKERARKVSPAPKP